MQIGWRWQLVQHVAIPKNLLCAPGASISLGLQVAPPWVLHPLAGHHICVIKGLERKGYGYGNIKACLWIDDSDKNTKQGLQLLLKIYWRNRQGAQQYTYL